MNHGIRTEIVINAPAERVYKILTDLENYENWNPFIVKSEGTAEKGRKVKNTLKSGEKLITFRPRVLVAEKDLAFEWLGSLIIPGLFDGHHYFKIEEITKNRINLIHGEKFSGFLSGFLLRKIGEQTRENFIKMNRALKSEAEKQIINLQDYPAVN